MSNRILDPTADLRKISWLNVLDQIGWAELQAATQLRSYGPGEVIFLEGDPPEVFEDKVLRLLAQELSNAEITE